MPAAAPVLRRFVVLCALGLWLGGLTFYALRVIRAAHQVVGSHLKVGFPTLRGFVVFRVFCGVLSPSAGLGVDRKLSG